MTTAVLPAAAGRRLGSLLTVVVVLVALLTSADRVAAYVASERIASQLRAQLGTTQPPEVAFFGFPLISQAIAGSYQRLTVDALGVEAGDLDRVDVRLDLRDIRLELSDALAGRIGNGEVGDARAEVTISDHSLSHLTGLPITIDGVTDDVARLSTRFEVFGKKLPVSIDAAVVVQGTVARLDVQGASAAGIDIPGFVVSTLSDLVGVEFTVPTLVDGMLVESVSAHDGSVVLHAAGRDVPFPAA